MHGAGRLHPHRGQLLPDAGVVEPQFALARQAQLDRGDDPAVRLALEHAVAVAEPAVLAREPLHLAGVALEGLYRFDELADLDAVGADVLDGRGADGARDQGHVLEPDQPARQGPADQVVPGHAGLGAHQGGVAVVLDDAHAGHRQADRDAGEIAGEQQVAAFAQHKHRALAQRGELEEFGQGIGARDVGHHRGAGGDAEGVAAGEGNVLRQLVAGHAGPPSRRRRIASTHSPTRSGPR